MLVFFGVGAVNAAVVTGAQTGLWQGRGGLGGWREPRNLYRGGVVRRPHQSRHHRPPPRSGTDFRGARVVPYWVAQTLGAAAASIVLYGMFFEAIIEFERQHGLLRGGPGSELSAMVFGEYFPNPAVFGTDEQAWRVVGPVTAFTAELIGTAMLAFLVFAVTSPRNPGRPPSAAAAVVIGVGVAAIISVVAPLTQAALNPARDFGPRAVSWFLGWGDIAIPGPRGGFFIVYILAPIAGAIIGAGVYKALSSLLPATSTDGS